MDTVQQRPVLKKLFDNKYFTYMMSAGSYRGTIMQVEIKVTGKSVQLVYTKVKDRR